MLDIIASTVRVFGCSIGNFVTIYLACRRSAIGWNRCEIVRALADVDFSCEFSVLEIVVEERVPHPVTS